MATLSRCPWGTQVTSPATKRDVHSSTPVYLSSDFAQMCLLHPRKYISLCITQNTSFFAISGCSCTAVNCMYGHGSLACNWLQCACQRITYGPVYSVCTYQPKAIWEWNAVHCEPVVAHSSRAVQTICGRPLYMTGKKLLRSTFHLRTRHTHPLLRKQQARRYPENSLFSCGRAMSTWKINHSDAHPMSTIKSHRQRPCLPREQFTGHPFWRHGRSCDIGTPWTVFRQRSCRLGKRGASERACACGGRCCIQTLSDMC